jgi:hypothetical protein
LPHEVDSWEIFLLSVWQCCLTFYPDNFTLNQNTLNINKML